MGSNKKRKANSIFWGIVFVLAVAVLGASSSSSEIFSFELDSDKALSKLQVTNIELPNVKCFIKTSLKVLDKSGNVIASDESPFLEKRPITTYSILKVGDNKIADTIQITPKIKCNVDGNVPMTVHNAQLKATVFGKNAKNEQIEVWNDNKQASGIQITIHDSELMTFTARVVDIFKYLPAGNYNSLLEVKIRGAIDMSYDAVNYVSYEIIVPDESIRTFVEVKVEDNAEPKDNPPDSSVGGGNEVELQNDSSVTELLDVDELILCASSLNVSCLTQTQFIPFYVLGIGGIVLVGAVSTRNKPPIYDQFGNRSG